MDNANDQLDVPVKSGLARLEHGFSVVEIAGIRLHIATMKDAVVAADQAIQERRYLTFGMLNVAKLVHAQKDSALRESLRQADLVLADGVPIVWLSKLQGTRLPERIAGIDLMSALLELADRKKYCVFLLGAKEEVNVNVAQWLEKTYPNSHVAGRRNGYFSEAEESEVASLIRDSSADILLVAMSPPKKELFLNRWSDYMHVPVCHGVGGSFDVVAGLTKRAPEWMQRFALEWLYRLLQEPRRLWKRYLVTNLAWLGLAGTILLRRYSKPHLASNSRGLSSRDSRDPKHPHG